VKRIAALSAVILAFTASPALAVNDPVAPGDECSASSQAIGHPANENQIEHGNIQGANPPFSVNNPGQSTGAKGSARSEALAHCKNAPPPA
jgi:hypothetical protein